jgi:hypothetical protein
LDDAEKVEKIVTRITGLRRLNLALVAEEADSTLHCLSAPALIRGVDLWLGSRPLSSR